MKKKKLPLEKKLFLRKEPVAALNAQQQSDINGGLALLTVRICTTETQYETCNTIPPGQMWCIAC